MIPPDITRDDILLALKEIEKEGEPDYRKSKVLSLIYQNRLYSPKYILSIVNRMKTGKELPSKDFDAKTAKNFFMDYNFPVVAKKNLENAVTKLKSTFANKDRYVELGNIIKSRDEVIKKYSFVFSQEHIGDITPEELIDFLEFKNNHHWTGLTRTKSKYINNIIGVRKILQTLLNEDIHIINRFQKIEIIAEDEGVKGLGKGILTAILHVAHPDRYGVWNGTSECGLKELDIWPEFRSKATEGEKYFVINELLNYLSVQVGVDLWTLDALWWRIDSTGPLSIRYWKLSPGRNAIYWPLWKEKNIVAIFCSQLLELTGPEILSMPQEELVSVFQEVYPEKERATAARQISNFIHEMKPGDKVVINRGKSSILAYGQIDSETFFDSNDASNLYKKVTWEKTDVDIPIPDSIKGKFMQTVVELTPDEYNLLTGSMQNYWGILPSDGKNKLGSELYYWDTWKENGIVTTSYWKSFIKAYGKSLLEYSEQEYLKVFRDFYPNKEHSDMIWKFIHQMHIGDKILLNRGKKSIFAIGEVTSEPFLDESGDTFVRKVNWKTLPEEIPIPVKLKGKFCRYIFSITPEEYEQIFHPEPISGDFYRLDQLLMKKGQVILYGPPGTGKTYHAKNYIEYRIKNSPKVSPPITEINRRFYWFSINPNRWDPENLWKDEEVVLWYGNMRQAFSDIEESDIVFCYASGTQYRRLIGIATCNRKTYSTDGIPQVFIKGLRKVDGPDWKTLKSDGVLAESVPIRMGARGTLFPLSVGEGLRILSMQGISPSELGVEELDATMYSIPFNSITFHPSFSYEEFIEGIMPSVGSDGTIVYQVKEGIFKTICRTAFNSILQYLGIEKIWNSESDIPNLTDEEKDHINSSSSEIPHFLMIDEINRGEISRIFGELITLLERDKRAGAPNQLPVTLPYSRTRFAIPPNLYIIGTMNTADKSIALVDVALRRRFGFIEMLPDHAALRKYLTHDSLDTQKIFTIAIDILEEINTRISKEFDRDHQIGHSYLMRLKECNSREQAVSELWSIWYDEILPLLQEYFYDAPTRLHAVIGDGFVEYNTHSLIIHPEKDEDEFLDALSNILNTDAE